MKKLLATLAVLVSIPAHAGNILDEIAKKLREVQKNAEQQQTQPGKPAQQPGRTNQPQSLRAGQSRKELGPATQFSDADLTANGMDIMGVKLGMSPTEVINVLRAKNISLAQTKTAFAYPSAQGDVARGNEAATPYEHPLVRLSAGDMRASPHDAMLIEFTPEEAPRVFHVWRHVTMPAGALLYAPWEKAVMEKYGSPMTTYTQQSNGDWVWTKAPAERNCGSAGSSISIPLGESAVIVHAGQADRCGGWALWIRASSQDPYVTVYELHLTGYGIIDNMTRTMWSKVQEHLKTREAANLERAREASNRKPDL